MTEDSYIVSDAGPPVGVSPLDLAEALVDPQVVRVLDRLARRYSGGMVEFEDLRQQALMHVIEQVQATHDPESGPLVAHIIGCLRRNMLWARRELLARRNGQDRGEQLTRTGDVETLLETHQPAEPDSAMEAAAEVEWLKGRLGRLTERQRHHVSLRMFLGPRPVLVARELGITVRWERRRWSAIQRALGGTGRAE